MKPNTKGTGTEYKQGLNYYLTITDWPDGRCKTEIQQCLPILSEPDLLVNDIKLNNIDLPEH